MSRIAALLLSSLVVVAGCRDEPEPPPVKEEAQQEEAEPEPTPAYLKVRQAFGLPIPPEVTDMTRGTRYIEVGTNLTLEEVDGFFRSRLVDYEFIRASPTRIHVIGLYSAMPRITITRRTTVGPIRVRYTEQIGPKMDEYLAENPPKKLEPGDEVTTELSDGKKLAPGAKYNEPYTPKPGDPLYTDGNRANFGKPFGKWVLN